MEDFSQFMGFPETLAKTSSRPADSAGIHLLMRNYHRYADESTLASIHPDDLTRNQDVTTEHLREVARIERMYEKKVQKAIKQ